MKKLRVGVVFGGRSAEHEVSVVSGESVMNALDPSKYEVVPMGITREGAWIIGDDAVRCLKEAPKDDVCSQHTIPLATVDVETGGLTLSQNHTDGSSVEVDIVFPVLHGSFGEDGKAQGLFEMFGVPYVGCDVMSSALAMDKVMAKTVWTVHGLPMPKYLPVKKTEWNDEPQTTKRMVAEGVKYPCFVKPANLGSSIGISKVNDASGLEKAIELAFEYDNTILIEQGIDAREIEVAVLGNNTVEASIPAEVVVADDFYSFEDKYIDGKSRTEIPADLTEEQAVEVQELAKKAYSALGCCGMGRVDFLMDRTTQKFYLNEINTIPGFTSISVYPKAWEASGLSYPKLLDKLIALALERHRAKQNLSTTFHSDSDWYKG